MRIFKKYRLGRIIPIDSNIKDIPFNQRYNYFMQLSTLQSIISDIYDLKRKTILDDLNDDFSRLTIHNSIINKINLVSK